MIVLLILSIYGCDRGVGKEPREVKNVTKNVLYGRWILSKQHTTKWTVERLPMNIDKYFLKIMKNGKLEYQFFYPYQDKKPTIKKGKWVLENNRLLLKKVKESITYKDSQGTYFTVESPKMVKPITENRHKSFQTFQELRFTQKDNKLILWDYDGDADARRYFMWEK